MSLAVGRTRLESTANEINSAWNKMWNLWFLWEMSQIWWVKMCSFPLPHVQAVRNESLYITPRICTPFHVSTWCISWAQERRTAESRVCFQKLYFYPWALNSGKLIQCSWPPGGAHGTACSVSILPLSMPEFLQRGNLKSEQCRGSHPLDAVSAGIWRRNAQNKTTPGKGKTSQTWGQMGQCAMDRSKRMW